MTLTNIKPRADGKYSVTIIYPGARNAFGGKYFPKVFNKIVSPEKLAELRAQAAPPPTPNQ